MAKRTKMPTDVNARAKAIVDLATSEDDPYDPDAGKDPEAVMRGREGGRKGGAARAQSLSPDERSAIARKAAAARWGAD